MKKVLITGGNGFLGSNLTRELYRQNYSMRILVRSSADLQCVADIPCEVFFGNIDNPEHVNAAIKGVDIVIHTAAITDQWGIPYAEYEKINFISTQHIVNACLQHGVSKLVYVSTANTIAPGSKACPGTELGGFTLFKSNSNYILTKYLAQQYISEMVEKKKLPAVIVNPTFMIGPNDVKPSSGKIVLYAMHKRILFFPPGGKNFVYIKDVCKGIIKAIDLGKPGSCYLLAGENLSYVDFFRMVTSKSGKGTLMIGVPAWLLKASGLIGTIKEKLLHRASKLNYANAYMLCVDNYYSGKKSERELDLTYTCTEDAVSDTILWFKENKYC